MRLNEYQNLANQSSEVPDPGTREADPTNILVLLLGMAGGVGELPVEHRKWLGKGKSHTQFHERTKEDLGVLLWHLSNAATNHGLTLEEVAKSNLDRAGMRRRISGKETAQYRLFDDEFPPTEQLPRRMDVSIEETAGTVITTIDGARVGDPLTDNRYEDDGYRFHDISHLANASILGWSPTLRALLGRKRKSNPKVDEVEDGGRAIVIEEGISAMVFSHTERRNFLCGAATVSYDLLRTIKDMTSHLEVSVRTEGDWEHAIMTGFDIWRQVKAKGKGRIVADLAQRTMSPVG